MSKENELEKRKRKIISHNKSIIQKATNVLTGKIDPFEVKIVEEIRTLEQIRKIIGDEDDLKRGLTGYESINDINSKQKEKLEEIISAKADPRWKSKYKKLVEFVAAPKKIKNFENNFIIPILNREDRNLIIAIPLQKTFPKVLPEIFFKENRELINDIFHSLETKIPREENVFEKRSEKIIESIPEIQEDFEFYDQILEIFEEIKKNTEIKLLKFILSENYMETLMRLQAVSYLVSNGYLELVPSPKVEIEESGKYKVIVSKNKKNDNQNHKKNSTIILGLSYNEWKSLQKYIKKGDLSNRPSLMNLG